jgi:exodeoxyribonuclease VII large subunit
MPDLWTVSDLNRYVKQMLEMDYRLRELSVSGEISGFRAYPSGHWYFTLKDSAAQVSCVMWRGRAERMRFVPRDGDAVVALGSVGLYEARGQYQLDVLSLQPAGEGVLYREFVRLKAQLEAEGLFDPDRKRPLPAWPARIGLVTSPKAAALRDMLNILRRRFPLAQVILSPTPVQGAEAPPHIVAALRACAEQQPDVILLARGGGSLEDLWCFNDERVVRAVAACPVPVVCGVGHETDFTLADFAADLRAPTPSAAAELVTPDRLQLEEDLLARAARLAETARAALGEKRWALTGVQAQLRALSPLGRLRAAQQRVDDLQARAFAALGYNVALQRARFQGLRQSLANISPMAVLARGYAVVSRPDGEVIRSAGRVQPGDPLNIRVADGEFGVTASPRPPDGGRRPEDTK